MSSHEQNRIEAWIDNTIAAVKEEVVAIHQAAASTPRTAIPPAAIAMGLTDVYIDDGMLEIGYWQVLKRVWLSKPKHAIEEEQVRRARLSVGKVSEGLKRERRETVVFLKEVMEVKEMLEKEGWEWQGRGKGKGRRR
ncbi:MAG: hypothetical protein Q9218_005735 [Villophora microphyllina]